MLCSDWIYCKHSISHPNTSPRIYLYYNKPISIIMVRILYEGVMGKDSELFKAAQTGNNAVLEKAFASFLKKSSSAGVGGGGGGGHSFGRCVCCVRGCIM